MMKDRPSEDLSSAGQDGAEFDDSTVVYGEVSRRPTTRAENFWDDFEEVCKSAGPDWHAVATNAWAFGPQSVGTCVLIDARKGGPFDSVNPASQSTGIQKDHLNQDIENTIETGFQIATFRGPLCAEPVEGWHTMSKNLKSIRRLSPKETTLPVAKHRSLVR